MLTPPASEAPQAPKRSEAVFIADRLEQDETKWTRIVTYFYEGDSFEYGIESLSARTEEDARRVCYSPKVNNELHSVFLRDVRLDMTRPH